MQDSGTDLSIGTIKKRRLSLNTERCCFCLKSFLVEETPTTLDLKKAQSLITVCKDRQDETAKYILANEVKICSGEQQLCYHKSCRSKYMHPFYRDSAETKPEESDNDKDASQYTRSRATHQMFNWRECCFICGTKCNPKKRGTWSRVMGTIDSNSKLYSQVLKAAEIRNDNDVIARLLSSNADLVAVEARYHRQPKSCLSKYISERNIKSATYKNQEKPSRDNIGLVEVLKDEYVGAIEDHLCVYELSTLKERYLQLASEKNIELKSETSSAYFKRLLSQVWPELRFIPRIGMADLVCSMTITIDDALRKTVSLKNTLSEVTEDTPEQIVDSSHSEPNDELSILHQAAKILRERVIKTKKLENEYFAPEEVSLESQKAFLDPMLLRFVMWLSNNKKLMEAADIHETDLDPKTLAISSDITALIASVITPEHLGLTVYLHHTFGSKKLIEDLNNLGYTISYSEVRHFLTSAAVETTQTQTATPSGGLVPVNIRQRQTGDLVLAAGDNWDHNEHTISGKRTTHAMTSILVHVRNNEQTASKRIPRVQERTLDTSMIPGTFSYFL